MQGPRLNDSSQQPSKLACMHACCSVIDGAPPSTGQPPCCLWCHQLPRNCHHSCRPDHGRLWLQPLLASQGRSLSHTSTTSCVPYLRHTQQLRAQRADVKRADLKPKTRRRGLTTPHQTAVLAFKASWAVKRYKLKPMYDFAPPRNPPFLARCGVVPNLWQDQVLCSRQQC